MTSDVNRGHVLVRRHPRPRATGEVLCFAHAGGSPGEYARWSDELPDDIRLSAVQLPGRGARAAEAPSTSVHEIAEEVAAARPTVPFVLFGHSFGGLLAHEVARALRARGGPAPERLIVSACPAPPLPHLSTPLHTLPDEAFLTEVERRWGRLPEPVRERPELLERAVAAFRADVTAFETYRCPADDPLECPVTAFVGDEERNALAPERWGAATRGPLSVRVLPGGHFYLRGDTQRAALLAEFRAALHPTTTPGASGAP